MHGDAGRIPGALLALPLRLAAGAIAVVVGLSALVVGVLIVLGRLKPQPELIIAGILVSGVAGGLHLAARRIARMGSVGLETLAAAVFGGFGMALVAGGGIMVFDDPVGFAVMAFGVPFIGAAYAVRRLFGMSSGRKRVVVAETTRPVAATRGASGIRRTQVFVEVDEDAGAAEVARVRQRWLRQQFAQRGDWVRGTVDAEGTRTRHWLVTAALIWALLALAALAAALYWQGDAWLMAVPPLMVALLLSATWTLRRIRHRRFGISRLRLRQVPLLLGERIEGRIETGIQQRQRPPRGFRLCLRCVHCYERSDRATGMRRTSRCRDVLWQRSRDQYGQASEGNPTCLTVPVDFTLPADQAPVTLPLTGDGIRWELEISAALPGIDYAETFSLPVLDAGIDMDAWPTPDR